MQKSNPMTLEVQTIILELFAIQAIQFGSFILKSGLESPIYVDMRLIISYPSLLNKISKELWKLASSLSFDVLCGVPYTAIPIATALSLEHEIPMIMRRKEIKTYGTKKAIEGVFKPGNRCLIIEDVVTSSNSILETVDCLSKEGIQVKDAITILNREQGGQENLKAKGIALHSLISIFDLLSTLLEEKKISEETFDRIHVFLRKSL